MNKRLIGGMILLFTLILGIPFAYDQSLDKEEGRRIPDYLSNQLNTGYFKIDPKTILTAIDHDNADVFIPLQEDPNSIESLTNIYFSWTQGDFLKIVSALGRSVWSDPMDLSDWNVYNFYFQVSCRENPKGFDYAAITYFKTNKRVYITRHVEIDPYYSMIRWGDGATYSQPIFYKWKGFNLAEAQIRVEDALRISEEHGGKEARQQVDNKCSIIISPSKNNDKWFVQYISTDFSALIDPNTGKYEMFSISK